LCVFSNVCERLSSSSSNTHTQTHTQTFPRHKKSSRNLLRHLTWLSFALMAIKILHRIDSLYTVMRYQKENGRRRGPLLRNNTRVSIRERARRECGSTAHDVPAVACAGSTPLSNHIFFSFLCSRRSLSENKE
jgi:hypothetical protein